MADPGYCDVAATLALQTATVLYNIIFAFPVRIITQA
jgi:hypothetical protein